MYSCIIFMILSIYKVTIKYIKKNILKQKFIKESILKVVNIWY